jgi:hypothetical protein
MTILGSEAFSLVCHVEKPLEKLVEKSYSYNNLCVGMCVWVEIEIWEMFEYAT